MKNIGKLVLSFLTAAALSFGSIALPEIRFIAPLPVTAYAEEYSLEQYVDSCFSNTAKKAISREELLKAADLYFNVLQPQAVNLLINKIPAFKEAANKNELSRNVGVYIFYKKGDNDIDAHKVASLSAAVTSIAQIDGGKVGIILQHDLNYLIVDGKMKTDNNEKAVWFINSVLHELVHSLMTDYNRTGLFGSGRPEYYGKKDPNADARIYVVNNYSQLIFPHWFLEGTACIVGGRDMEAVKELRAFSVSDDATVHTYTAKSVFELYVKKTKYQLSSQNDTSLYSTSIPATLYLCELQAVKSGRSSISTDADGKKVFDSSVLRSGFNTILTRLHDGETLDAVIADISDGNFSSTDDFTERFIKGDWNIIEASEADPCKGMDNNSSQFTADLMNYLESLDVKYGHPVTCSILYDFDDPREYVLDISKKSTAEFYKPTLSGDYELLIDLPEPYTDGGKSAVGTSTPSREELYAFVKAEAEKEWAEFDAESFNSAGTKEAAAMTAILNSPSNFLKAAALAQERVDCNALLTYIIYTKPKAFDTFLDNSIKYDDSFIYDDDAFSLILEKIEEVPATCTEPGTAAYFIGNDGKKYDLYKEISDEDLVVPALGHDYKKTVIKEVTCTEDGEYEFKCSRCDSSYKTNPKAKGHKWKVSYTWSEDYSTCTGDAVCKNDKSHTATETVTATSEVTKEAKCTTKGSMTYTAEFTDKAFKTQTKTVEIPALGHDRDENGVCKRCGDTPSRGPSGGGSTPTTPTTTTTTTSELKPDGDVIHGTPNRFAWKPIPDAKSYSLWLNLGGKPVFLQDQTETFAEFVYGADGKIYLRNGDKFDVYTYGDGKFTKTGSISADKIDTVKVKNNVTNEFMVKCKSGGKEVKLTVSIKTYYKPAVNATATKNGALLKWEKVDGATKYRLSKLVNGKLKKVADVNGTAINLTGLKSGKEYTYAVKALVSNEWTTVWKSDLVTVTAK